ncbi:MAG TPA: STAS domain-containing protein [Humisphaera sp.]
MVNDWFTVTEEASAFVLALAIPPHVDSADVDKLHEAVLEAISANAAGAWVIDLAAMSFMGSSVLGLMVNLRQRIRTAGGRLALCGMNPKLHQVFRTCSLERLFSIRQGRAEALDEVTS